MEDLQQLALHKRRVHTSPRSACYCSNASTSVISLALANAQNQNKLFQLQMQMAYKVGELTVKRFPWCYEKQMLLHISGSDL